MNNYSSNNNEKIIDNNLNKNKKLNNLFDKFISKLTEDNKNYNNIKSINNNYFKKIKINNIFLDNNEIINVNSTKIKKTSIIEKDLNIFLKNSKFLDNYFVRKIFLFKISINENNIKNFLSFDYNNFGDFYNILFINFNVINNYLHIIDKNDNIKKFENINNFFFLDDLDSIYLFFEKKEINYFSNKLVKPIELKSRTKTQKFLVNNNKKTKKITNNI